MDQLQYLEIMFLIFRPENKPSLTCSIFGYRIAPFYLIAPILFNRANSI